MQGLRSAGHARPQKGRWHKIQSLFFIFVFSLSVYVALQSPIFSVKEIRVNGNKNQGKSELVALTGLTKGVNIFKANLKEAQDRIAAHPMVKQAYLSRELPATIVIDITERKPVCLLVGQGCFISVSEDGYHLAEVSNLSKANFPIVTGVNPGSAGPGQKISDERLQSALTYLLAMPLNIRAAVSELNVSDLDNIRMFTLDRAEVKFGDTARVDEKIKLYREVISQKYTGRIQYIDISYKGSPVVKLIN